MRGTEEWMRGLCVLMLAVFAIPACDKGDGKADNSKKWVTAAKCKTDKDCPSSETSHCNAKSGICVACTADAHCAGNSWEKLCDTTKHRCVECLKDVNCTANTLGSKCKGSICNCTADADCKGNLHGGVCDSKYKACSCIKDADCAGGKKCLTSKLSNRIKLCK